MSGGIEALKPQVSSPAVSSVPLYIFLARFVRETAALRPQKLSRHLAKFSLQIFVKMKPFDEFSPQNPPCGAH